MHGFGGGYFPPILGTRSRPAGPLPKMTLEENMTVVVQPNVIARDEKPRGAGRRADPRDEDRFRAAAQGAARLLPRMKPVTDRRRRPGGLTVALSLAHQGVPVRVLEAEPALTLDQRAGSFHPPTLEMLAPFGVTEAMHRSASRCRAGRSATAAKA